MQFLDLRKNGGDLVVAADVERQHRRLWCQLLGQISDMFFEAALIGEDERRTALRACLRDRPGKRTVIRDADNEADSSREVRHQRFFLPRRRRPPPCPCPCPCPGPCGRSPCWLP